MTFPDRDCSKADFQSRLSLPTARALPIGRSGDFGTSPFLGQLSDKQLLGTMRHRGSFFYSWKVLFFDVNIGV
jgi:hypothetical protein